MVPPRRGFVISPGTPDVHFGFPSIDEVGSPALKGYRGDVRRGSAVSARHMRAREMRRQEQRQIARFEVGQGRE